MIYVRKEVFNCWKKSDVEKEGDREDGQRKRRRQGVNKQIRQG